MENCVKVEDVFWRAFLTFFLSKLVQKSIKNRSKFGLGLTSASYRGLRRPYLKSGVHNAVMYPCFVTKSGVHNGCYVPPFSRYCVFSRFFSFFFRLLWTFAFLSVFFRFLSRFAEKNSAFLSVFSDFWVAQASGQNNSRVSGQTNSRRFLGKITRVSFLGKITCVGFWAN